MTTKELRQIAKQKGIKYATKMNSTTLCELLGLPLVKNLKFEKFSKGKINIPVGILFVNEDDEKTQMFKSITQAAKSMNKNPSCNLHYIKKNKEIRIGEDTFLVRREASSGRAPRLQAERGLRPSTTPSVGLRPSPSVKNA